jgi:hypothetical protein
MANAGVVEQKILITADTAGAIKNIRIVKDTTREMSEEVAKSASAFTKAGTSIGKSAAQFATVFLGVGSAIYAVANFTKQAIAAATSYQTKLIGLQIQANNLGISTDQLKGAIQELTKDGYLTQKDAVESLAYMFSGYVQSVPEAMAVMSDIKNLAAAGGEGMYDYSEKVRGLTESYLTLMSRIGDKRGLAENWNRIIEVGEQVTKKRYEAEGLMGQRLILTAGLHAVAQRAVGAYDRMQETNIGTINKARTGIAQLSLNLGNALLPAIVILANAFNTSTGSGKAFADICKVIGIVAATAATFVTTLAMGVRNLVQDIGAIGEGWGNFGTLMKTQGEEAMTVWADLQTQIEDIRKGDVGFTFKDIFGAADLDWAKEAGANAGKAAAKAAEEIQKEMESYARSLQKRDADYMRSMAELIWAHQEKRDSIIKDLDEENGAYEKSNAERLSDFNRTVAEMERNHLRKVRDTNDDLANEEEDHARRVRDIEQDLAAERAKGIYIYGVWNSSANAQRIADLEQALADENDAYQERLSGIKQNIADELEDYNLALEEKKLNFQEETAVAQTEHQKKIANLQTELDTENQLLTQHAGQVAMIKDQMKENDIQRLMRQHAEEVAEDERSHKERIQNAIKSGEEAGAGFGDGVKEKAKQPMQEFHDDISFKFADLADSATIEGEKTGKNWINNLIQGLKNAAINAVAKNPFLKPASVGGFNIGDLLNLKFQHGGIIPGPIGAPVPAIVHGGERVIPVGGKELATRTSAGGGGATVNIYGNLTVDSEERVKQLAELISRMLGRESELSRYGVGY